MNLYVGIDVGLKSNVVCMMKPDGTRLQTFSISNDPVGCDHLAHKIQSALDKLALQNVILGMEATSHYGSHLIKALKSHESLTSYGKKFLVINPRQIEIYRKSYNDIPKNDKMDAFMIARFLKDRAADYEERNPGESYEALRYLTRQRLKLVENIVKAKQRLMQQLFLKYSALAQTKVFSNSYSTTALAVYEEFASAEDLAAMDMDDLITFVKEKGRNCFAHPEQVAEALKKAAASSFHLSKPIGDAVNYAIRSSVSLIRFMEKQKKELDQEIKKHMKLIPNTLLSIPGFGPVCTAGILAEIGCIERFKSQASLAKYAGLAWTQHQSAEFEAENTKSISSGNRYLKYYLHEAALLLVSCNTEYKNFYKRKYDEVKLHKHKRALALTARKLVRLVFHLLKYQCLYRPSTALAPLA